DQVMKTVPEDVLVVFDEAYYEYVERSDYPQTLDYVRDTRTIITLRTFSKIYGLAGLRIGYGISRPDIIQVMNKVRQPFNVSSVAQAAARASLRDKDHVAKSVKLNREGKKYLYAEFRRMGLDFVPSETNFILVHLDRPGSEVMSQLLKEGVIVRPMTGYEFPNSVRVTVGTMEQDKRLISSLEKVLGK
ncbi:MAG: pyridoxal phosphate-dependent aminotransferase, partial [Bacteroidota bacterium]